MIDTQLVIGISGACMSLITGALVYNVLQAREIARRYSHAEKELYASECKHAHTLSVLQQADETIESMKQDASHQKASYGTLQLQLNTLEKRSKAALECRTSKPNGTVRKICEILDGTRDRRERYRQVAQNAANEWDKPVHVYMSEPGYFTHTMQKRTPSLVFKKYCYTVTPVTALDKAKKFAQGRANDTCGIHCVYSYTTNGGTQYITRAQNLTSIHKLKTKHEYTLVAKVGPQAPQVKS